MPVGKTLIGNWQEERVYHEDKKKLANNVKLSGGMLSQQIISKYRRLTQPCEIWAPQDPHAPLMFSCPIMLQNAETNGYLSYDSDDVVPGSRWPKIAVTTTPQKTPVFRSVFIPVQIPCIEDNIYAQRGESSIVHYGQRIALQALPLPPISSPQSSLPGTGESMQRESAPGEDSASQQSPLLYLCSEKKIPGASQSKATNRQFVYLSSDAGQNGVWSFEYANSEYREDMHMHPVEVNKLLTLRHNQTGLPLASTRTKYLNDFGPEWEVCCHHCQKYESKMKAAPEEKAVFWVVVSQSAASQGPQETEINFEPPR